MKKILCLLTAAVLMLCMVSALADDNISVVLDGKTLEFDTQPVLVNDRTMVPMRVIFEELGATVKWDEPSQRVEAIFDNGIHILLYIDKKTAYKNGELINLDAAPFIKDSRTFVPIRFVSESSKAAVGWVDETSTVTIASADKTYDFVPFGAYMSIPAPSSASSAFKVADYTNTEKETTVVYDVSAVTLDEVAKYEQLLISRGFELISGGIEDKEKTFYNGSTVIKTTLDAAAEIPAYTVVLYSDKTGESIAN